MNAGRLGAKSGPIHTQAKDDYKALKRQILARFPGADAATLGRWTLGDQTLLGPEATVAWMYALAEKAGASSVGDRAALGIYGFLSNMTHPTLYPARQLRAWTDDPAVGHPVAYLRLDLDFLERQASAAVTAFYNALSYVTSYFGWPRSVHDELTAKIDQAMPTLFS